MNTEQQVYLADLDKPSPDEDIRRYKDAMHEQVIRKDMELNTRQQHPELSTREVNRKVEREFKKCRASL
jgi:hypothetical protein